VCKKKAKFLQLNLAVHLLAFSSEPSKAQWYLYVPPGLTFSNSTFCPHSVFMCFVWISEQTAIISLYNINWLVVITETESVYCAVRTGSLYIIQVICFVWIWEQTAIISQYSINWLVCITETVSVYCAVRTGYLNIFQVMCFVWIWEQTAIISLYSMNWLVFMSETECVYCAVWTEYLYIIHVSYCLKRMKKSKLHWSTLESQWSQSEIPRTLTERFCNLSWRGAWFASRPGHWSVLTEFFCFPLNLSVQTPAQYLE